MAWVQIERSQLKKMLSCPAIKFWAENVSNWDDRLIDHWECDGWVENEEIKEEIMKITKISREQAINMAGVLLDETEYKNCEQRNRHIETIIDNWDSNGQIEKCPIDIARDCFETYSKDVIFNLDALNKIRDSYEEAYAKKGESQCQDHSNK